MKIGMPAPRLRSALALTALLALATPAVAAPSSERGGGPLAWLADAWQSAAQWVAAATGTSDGDTRHQADPNNATNSTGDGSGNGDTRQQIDPNN